MFQFGTKAETLESLRPHITKAEICPSCIFTVGDWNTNYAYFIKQIRRQFSGQSVIVRSSALNEDSVVSAMAGIHDSVAEIPAASEKLLTEAVSKVIKSYQKSSNGNINHQVLVQPMVKDVSMSGVVFTQDLNTGGPYYVINYDDVSGKTDSITLGKGDHNRTLLIHRGHLHALHSSRFRSLIDAVVEIENLSPATGLDIEFAVTGDEKVYILQVRRLAVQENWNRNISRQVDVALAQIRSFLKNRFQPIYGVYGKKSVFGVMPDWNPAEIIGTAPRNLSMSLYRYLVTDSIWAEARAAMGYRDCSGRPLMVSLAGRVYIDVRESFNSFLPASIQPNIGEKLVQYWTSMLEQHPVLHDKIEFEVATTIHSFDFNSKNAKALHDAGLTPEEIKRYELSLKVLTNQIVGGDPDIIPTQLELVARMVRQHESALIDKENDSHTDNLLYLIKKLLDDCRDLGTKPFSIIARCGFIAEELLRSLVRIGLIGNEGVLRFRKSVKTVLSDFLEAVHRYQSGDIDKETFLGEYGHLRPGTYDILSKRYDQRDDFLKTGKAFSRQGLADGDNSFRLAEKEIQQLNQFLKNDGYSFDVERLFQFMQDAISAREYAKLKFTRNLSDVLELIAQWGSAKGLSREELSHLNIQDILRVSHEAPPVSLEDYFRNLSKSSREQYEITKAIRLPFLITSVDDVDIIPLLKSRPNFITHKSIQAPIVFLRGSEIQSSSLENRLVLVEGADPGYDWIFINQIAGLATTYGGANSHMAIRCAELGIPAAIGCGEQLFEVLQQSHSVLLDCGAGMIVPIR